MACVEWFKYKYQNPGRGLIVSVPNEGRRNAKTGGRLKKMGLAAGCPDLFIVKKGSKAILFIEMKTEHHLSELSEVQEDMHRILKSFGQTVFICRSLDEFMKVVDRWFQNF